MIEVFILALVVSIFFAILGLFVVLRGESFLGAGLSHAAFGGAGLGIFLNIDPIASALAYTLAVAAFIERVASSLSRDAVIGVVFAFSMAVGVLAVSASTTYGDALSLLFGSILAATNLKIVMVSAFFAFILAWLYLNWKPLYYTSFDPEFCRARGTNVEALDMQFLLILAAAIVLGMPLVGVLLISAFLVIPASTALLFKRGFKTTIALSLLFAVVSSLLGVALAYIYDLPAGALIVIILSLLFVAVYLWRRYYE